MTPHGAIELLERYGQVQEALDRDDLDEADRLLAEVDVLIADPAPAGSDQVLLMALATQVEDARLAAVQAQERARARLLRLAQQELRAGGDGARAYAGGDDRPDARFIDRTS